MNFQEQMSLTLLYTLQRLSGSAGRQEILQHINDHGYWFVNDETDHRKYTRPEGQWRNDFSFEREHLKRQGRLRDDSPHGVWEITPKGEAYLAALIGKARGFTFTGTSRITPALLQEVFSEQPFDEASQDQQLIERVSLQAERAFEKADIPAAEGPRQKGTPLKLSDGRNVYPRDPSVAKRALDRAGHRCEIDPEHPSFLRRNGSSLYMEPHHLIPMSMTDYFNVCLDREQNIFSLCSTCHNQIHYGTKEDVRRLVAALFHSRESELRSILGRPISLEELYRIYRVL